MNEEINGKWSFVTQIFHNGLPGHGGEPKTFGVIKFKDIQNKA